MKPIQVKDPTTIVQFVLEASAEAAGQDAHLLTRDLAQERTKVFSVARSCWWCQSGTAVVILSERMMTLQGHVFYVTVQFSLIISGQTHHAGCMGSSKTTTLHAPSSGTAASARDYFYIFYFCIHTTFENNTDISNKKV